MANLLAKVGHARLDLAVLCARSIHPVCILPIVHTYTCIKQTREHKLSSENRVHFSEGFIQVPVADSKELYGIKFKDVIQGEEFYMRMVQALGKI